MYSDATISAANIPPRSPTKHFNHPGIAITVSSGDAGYAVEFPAASKYVTAVGGTTLTRDASSRGFSETVWSGAGSGCSLYISKPSWQTDTGCSRRTVADVFGGTSVSAPIIGGVYALAGNASSLTYGSFSYSHLSSLFDIISGNNGSCGGSYLCTAVVGFDGPTGNGTPNGTGAF